MTVYIVGGVAVWTVLAFALGRILGRAIQEAEEALVEDFYLG